MFSAYVFMTNMVANFFVPTNRLTSSQVPAYEKRQFRLMFFPGSFQFVIFKPLSYCFEETIGFDVRTSFAGRPLSRLIR